VTNFVPSQRAIARICAEDIERLAELSEEYSSIRDLANILLLAGGKTVLFDGWGNAEDLETIAAVGKFIDAKDVDTAMARLAECEEGFCHSNAGELLSIHSDFQPVYAFALNYLYKKCPFWMEHFILKHIPTGKYHESTDIITIKKCFVMDISKRQFMDMMEREPSW